MRHLLLSCLILLSTVQLFSQLVINEFSSSNQNGIKDEDGEQNDWIELYNHSASEINLNGYYLSDDALFRKKWSFPALSLKHDSYLLVFASGKNRVKLPFSYQTLVFKGDIWQYIIPSSEIGTAWQVSGFDASSWNSGSSGFGYGDNDDATVLNNISSLFIRKEFLIENLQDIRELVLSIDYDDGFIAYLNGHEIARRNLGANGSVVRYNELTGSSSREATMYLGGAPENIAVTDPGRFLVQGINVIAIQGHNSDAGSSDFSLIPILSIGLEGAGYADNLPDYIHLAGRKLHTSFRISDEGETLLLSRPDSSIVDSVTSIPLIPDISYGRKPDGAASWLYFSPPTPATSNITDGYGTISGDTVIFSVKGGYYPGGIEVKLSTREESDSLFFSLDGSEPTIFDSLYSGPILITKNTILRARSISFKKLPGQITTNTYITKMHTLPVVSLSTDPANLWDNSTGIYVKGPDAQAPFPYFGANFWQDWERTAHMELYDINGIKQVDQDVGIKIFGSYSRGNDQKSLALFARQGYGKGSFEYRFFKDKPIDKFESIILRNAGNDWGQAHMRDGLTTTLIRNMDIDRMAFQPSVVYLNGEYWGILNIREKINRNYLAENHFVNPDNVNILEFNGSVVEGSNTAYQQMLVFAETHTLENEQTYLQVSKKMNINNYIQYQLTEIYVNNKDWPGNNIKFWNTNTPGSLWRWIIYDTDFGFSIWENLAYSFNTVRFALYASGTDWPNPSWSTLLFRRMMSNPSFRNEFANQFMDRLNTNFTAAKVNAAIDSLKEVFLPEIDGHLNRWGMDRNNWENNYATIKNFARYRPDYLRGYLRSELGLGQVLDIKVEIDNPGTGSVKVNSVFPEKYPFDGLYFKDLPIKLTAIPAPGYKFVRWEIGNLVSHTNSIDYNMLEPGRFKVFFEPASDTDTRIVINEINYSSSSVRDTKDWIELLNSGNSTVNLKDWVLSDNDFASGYTFSDDLFLSPGMYIVVCRDLMEFKQFNTGMLNCTGDFNFGLSSSGDDINLFNQDGVLVDFVHYSVNAPWPGDAAGTGSSIELVNPLSDNNNGANWKSSAAGGTPGILNIKTLPPQNPDDGSADFCKLSCYPNPVRDYTTLRIEVSLPGKYRLEVFDLSGKPRTILADQVIEEGVFYIEWYGRDSNNSKLPGGVYIIRLAGEKMRSNLKVVILE